MKNLLKLILAAGLSYSVLANADGPNDALLPSQFIIFTDGESVQSTPAPGFYPRRLPTANNYTGPDGCYVFCYSHHPYGSIFKAGDNIYVNGQIRVRGNYFKSVCLPDGYGFSDISRSQDFTDLCSNNIITCRGSNCWAGGDTGRWFGL